MYLSDLRGFILCGLVIPMLEVLVNSSFLRRLVLLHHGTESSLRGGRVLVHGFVEGGIASMILGLEF